LKKISRIIGKVNLEKSIAMLTITDSRVVYIYKNGSYALQNVNASYPLLSLLMVYKVFLRAAEQRLTLQLYGQLTQAHAYAYAS